MNRFSSIALLLWLLPGCLALGVWAQEPQDAPSKKVYLPKDPKRAAYMLKLQSNEELVKVVRSEPVYIALLERAGLDRKWREEAATGLSRLHETDRLQELLGAVARVGAAGDEPSRSVLRELASMVLATPREELAASSETFADLAVDQNPLVRQIGLAALVTVREDARQIAASFPAQLSDLLLSAAQLQDRAVLDTYFAIAEANWNAEDADLRRAALAAASYIPTRTAPTLQRLETALASDTDVSVVLESLARIPQGGWPAESRRGIADAAIELLRRTPSDLRTVSPAQDATALIQRIAASVSEQDAVAILAGLDDLRVKQYVIRAPFEQMAFDPNVIVVPAGQSIEIVFRNEDDKPHNFLLAEPGRFEDVGLAAQAMATSPEGQAKNFVPENVGVLQASTMVWPGQMARLSLTSPARPGVYPFICTFPGHWLKMYGAMIVAEDVDAYLAATPKLPTADELLGRQIVQEWTFDDLAADAAGLSDSSRNFANGQRLFARLSCVSCHKLGSQGLLTASIGPELTQIAKKYPQPADLLHEIVEPSRNIEDKFASVVLTANGKAIRGVVVERDDTQVILKENPLINCEPTVVRLSDVEDEEKSKISPMPVGLLNTLHRDQILDLLAFVYAGGDAKNLLFTGR